MGKEKKKHKRSRHHSESDSDASSTSSSSDHDKRKASSSSSSRSKSRKDEDKDRNKDKDKHENMEREREKEKKSKHSIKETPQERAARKAAKKKRREQAEKIHGYSNEDNPFNDANLTQAFVWKKKIEKDVASGLDPLKLTKDYRRKEQERLKQEIEDVKARRLKREREKAEQEALREQMEREIAMNENLDWEEKEEEFHLKQAALRSNIRIREGREKAIDLLAKNVNMFGNNKDGDDDDNDDYDEYGRRRNKNNNSNSNDNNNSIDLDVELTEPYLIFEGLDMYELEELKNDIQIHINLGNNLDYWQALYVICNDELLKVKSLQHGNNSSSGGASNNNNIRRHDAVPDAVRDHVIELFENKTLVELNNMEQEIRTRINQHHKYEEAIDIEYWESILKQLQTYKAKAFLHEFHVDLLKKRLAQLKAQHLQEMMRSGADNVASSSSASKAANYNSSGNGNSSSSNNNNSSSSSSSSHNKDNGSGDDDFEPELIPYDESSDDPHARSYSPTPLEMNNEQMVHAIDPEKDAAELEAQRRKVQQQRETQMQEMRQKLYQKDAANNNRNSDNTIETSDQLYNKESNQAMDVDEELFNMETEVSQQPHWWHDKYRPRKPRYFNRVKTGFDWHKYNQAHYDKDNPPPKVVQGYKFNIFYPDLIDPSKPPIYRLERDPTNSDYCIIRFSAGPPYEDIAFKIVRKEWEHSHRRGYKCVFDRGVLHLHFNFRRYFYRR